MKSGDEPVIWSASPGPQTRFLASTAYEVLYGGAAGGGKSAALLMAPLRYLARTDFRALLLRRTFPELQRSLIERSRMFYPHCGGVYNEQSKTWRFPSGAVIEFGHLEHEHSVHAYQSAEYQFIGFDELTTFTEKQYVYMLSRARSGSGIPIRIRSASNPGGVGMEWVLKRWAPWLDKGVEYNGIKAGPGEVLRYSNGDSGDDWGENGLLSRVFIPARVTDNPHLMQNDPGYLDRLSGLDAVTRAQLRDGDWMVRPAPGLYFKRQWLKWLDTKPSNVAGRVRRWDLASVEGAGDYTVGVLMSRDDDGNYFIEDVVRGRWRPDGVQKTVLATARMDSQDVRIVLPQDPGQAGVAQRDAYAKLLVGFNIRSERETGDKVTRAQPFSAQVEAGNVTLIRGMWNDAFVQEMEAFPSEGVHDDQVDAAAGAFNDLLDNVVTFGTAQFKSPKRFGAMPEGFDDDD